MNASDVTEISRPGCAHSLGHGLWQELVEGRYVVQESTHSPTHCILELTRIEGAVRCREKERRCAALLRRLLVGEAQKSVAYSRAVSTSTVAGACGNSLARMGLPRKLLQVPYLLVRAAHVDSGMALPPCEVEQHGGICYVTVARPDLTLDSVLSAGECSVTGLLMEGLTNEAIAQRRGVSVRTIANQLASVYRKLHT